jgi:hypothetical protein
MFRSAFSQKYFCKKKAAPELKRTDSDSWKCAVSALHSRRCRDPQKPFISPPLILANRAGASRSTFVLGKIVIGRHWAVSRPPPLTSCAGFSCLLLDLKLAMYLSHISLRRTLHLVPQLPTHSAHYFPHPRLEHYNLHHEFRYWQSPRTPVQAEK